MHVSWVRRMLRCRVLSEKHWDVSGETKMCHPHGQQEGEPGDACSPGERMKKVDLRKVKNGRKE